MGAIPYPCWDLSSNVIEVSKRGYRERKLFIWLGCMQTETFWCEMQNNPGIICLKKVIPFRLCAPLYYQIETQIKAKMINYIHNFTWDIITLPCRNLNDSLAKLPSKLGHGCIIASYCFMWMNLLFHVLNSIVVFVLFEAPGKVWFSFATWSIGDTNCKGSARVLISYSNKRTVYIITNANSYSVILWLAIIYWKVRRWRWKEDYVFHLCNDN